MSELSELPPPPLSPEARAFLDGHAATGEPSDDALARGQRRLEEALREPVQTPHLTSVGPTPPARRGLRLPGELLAAAAVLAVMLGVQLVLWVVKSQSAAQATTQALDAYAAGDLGRAQQQLAGCTADDCVALAAKLGKASALSQRLEALSGEEVKELAALDAELAPGRASVIGAQLEQRQAPLAARPDEGKTALDEAEAAAKAGRFDDAVQVLERCTRLEPPHLPCFPKLGALYLQLATSQRQPAALANAERVFRRYVELAPPGEVERAQRSVDEVALLRESQQPAAPASPAPRPTPPVAPGDTLTPMGGSDEVALGLRGMPGNPEAARLYDEAMRAKSERNYERAVVRLERCLKIAPDEPTCVAQLGSLYAAIGARDWSATDMEKAKRYYERYLTVAPADHAWRAQVQKILDDAKDEGARRGSAPLAPPPSSLPLVQPMLPPPPEAEPPSSEPERLFAEANALRKQKDFDRAVVRLERCIKLQPRFAPCYRMLGTVHASLASRDQSASDMAKAKAYYERFVMLAPPDDEFVPKVQRILEMAHHDPAEPPRPTPERAAQERLHVPLGGHSVLRPTEPVSRIAVGDTQVADVTVRGPQELLIEGKGKGLTTLLVWTVAGERKAWLIDVR